MKRLARFSMLAALLAMMGWWAASAQSTVDLVAIDKAGWWTRRPAAQPVGPGNFEVAAGVQGEESIAALRVLIHGEITKATLVLAELDAPLAPVAPGALQVCTTSVPWLYVDGGAYADAPKADCSHAIPLTRQVDASGVGSWTADVTQPVGGARSETTLMILPVIDSTAVVPPTYFIKMSAHVAAEGTPDVKAPAVVAAPPPVSPAVNRPSAPRPTATPAPTAAAPAAAPATTATTTPTSQPRRFAPVSSNAPSKPWGKLVLLIPLATIFGAAYTAAQRYATDRVSVS
jgi:hypothetical protein